MKKINENDANLGYKFKKDPCKVDINRDKSFLIIKENMGVLNEGEKALICSEVFRSR